LIFHCALSVLRTRKETKKPLLTSGNSGIRSGDFVRIKILIRASVENPVLNQATVHLRCRLADVALHNANPNAWTELKQSSARRAKYFLRKI